MFRERAYSSRRAITLVEDSTRKSVSRSLGVFINISLAFIFRSPLTTCNRSIQQPPGHWVYLVFSSYINPNLTFRKNNHLIFWFSIMISLNPVLSFCCSSNATLIKSVSESFFFLFHKVCSTPGLFILYYVFVHQYWVNSSEM